MHVCTVRLAPGEDDQEAMRVHVRQDLIDNPKEILAWHIFLLTGDTAVAPAMTAGDIAPERTLPKERTQAVFGHRTLMERREEP